jgi:D-alanyl-D-alanine carboxypeptidase (penicillin-binding protein 5/6)
MLNTLLTRLDPIDRRCCHALLLLAVIAAPIGLRAETPPAGDAEEAATPAIAALDGDFEAAILVDAASGMVLAAKNPDQVRQPASMLKMLTELIVLERIEEGDLALTDTVTVSARASRMGGSQVYLAHGEEFTVEELLAALAIHSANDAAVALAEHTAGSVEAFVDLMNDRARRLGMASSEFHSVHGLPPGRGQQPDLTTPRDMAIVGRELLRHPAALEWSRQPTAPFRDGEFQLYNPNKLVGKYRGLDGLKTGYHGRAGYCVTATAVQKDVRLLSVVMGCPTDRARATETTRLLSYGFNLYEKLPLIEEAGAPLERMLAVEGGKAAEIGVVYADPLVVSVPRTRQEDVTVEVELDEPVAAPVAQGEKVGEAVAMLDGFELGRVDLLAAESVDEGNWFHRLFH